MIFNISVPVSKSIVIRELIRDYVHTGIVHRVWPDSCTDILVTAQALRTIRKHVKSKEQIVVDVQDCGSAYRFLLPILAGTPGEWLLTGTPRLLQRPIEELVDTLVNAGADISRQPDGLHIHGKKLRIRTVTIDCSRTSQYASALLLAAPLLKLRTMRITPKEVRSSSYIDLTQQFTRGQVRIFGMPYRKKKIGLYGDWSAAVFWYAHALLHRKTMELMGLSLPSPQGDSIIARWFEQLGMESQATEPWVTITPKTELPSAAVTFDVADHPDTVPVMAVLAALLPADITFRHTRNLQYKESDRIQHLAEQLCEFADIEVGEDHFRVAGRPDSRERMAGCCFRTWHDHRLAMAFLLAVGPDNLDDTECLDKSYPEFLYHIKHSTKLVQSF
ncbi:MAG: hypothetical protein J5741_05875 [Bacteroidales bacterium]|nr:hypothetical protein [Bacteroidales bacterium]